VPIKLLGLESPIPARDVQPESAPGPGEKHAPLLRSAGLRCASGSMTSRQAGLRRRSGARPLWQPWASGLRARAFTIPSLSGRDAGSARV